MGQPDLKILTVQENVISSQHDFLLFCTQSQSEVTGGFTWEGGWELIPFDSLIGSLHTPLIATETTLSVWHSFSFNWIESFARTFGDSEKLHDVFCQSASKASRNCQILRTEASWGFLKFCIDFLMFVELCNLLCLHDQFYKISLPVRAVKSLIWFS